MPDELERLQINIEADASGTAAGAAQAKQALHSLQQDAKRATDGIQRGMDKAAQATKSVAQAAEAARKTLRPLAANPVNPGSVQQMRAAAKSAQESVRKTLQPAMVNPVNERGNAGSYKKYEFAKMPHVEMAKQAADMTQTAASTAKVARAADSAAKKVREVRKEVERVGRKGPTIMQSIGRSLRSMLIITVAARGIQSMVRWMGALVVSDKEVAASLATVKGNLASSFAPIYSAAIPAIRSLIGWLASATSWIATFISTLFGMSGGYAQEIAKGLDDIGGSAGGAGKKMKELLGSFDELNKLDRSESGGGGGGGGGLKFEDLPEIESAVNAANKVSEFWTAWGDWIKAGAFAGGTAWLLSKFADLMSKIKSGINPLATITRNMKELGETANDLGDNLGEVSKNATITYSVAGDDEVAKATERIMRGCKQLTAKPFVLEFAHRDNITATIERIKQELRELSARKTIVQVGANTREGINAINDLNAALNKIPRIIQVGVNVGVNVDTNVQYQAEGGGGTTRGGGGGRNDRYSSSNGGTANNTARTNSLSNALTALKDKIVNVLGFASGSLNIPKGDLFIANESGAEMVGTIGGKTAVANQQEISGAIWREMQQYRADGTASGDDIANAVARALNGTAVKVGERQFGTLVVQAVNKNTRQMGRVDFAF